MMRNGPLIKRRSRQQSLNMVMASMFRSVYRRISNVHLSPSSSLPIHPRLRLPQPVRFYSQSQALCPSCSKPLPTPLPACPNCAYIAAIAPHSSYHDIFGLPEEPNPFVIDTAELKRRFRQAQAICHPDAWSTKGQVRPAFVSHHLSLTIYSAKIRFGADCFLAYKSGLPDSTVPTLPRRAYSS
jgi:hypothetical protein